jgi:predicted PurR-regulated permease PerM
LIKLLVSTAFAVFLYAAYVGGSILLAVLYAAIAVLLTSPILAVLESWRIPKFLSALLVCLGGLCIFVLLGGALIPLLLEQFSLLANRADILLKSSQAFFSTPDSLRIYFEGSWIASTGVVIDFEQIQGVFVNHLSTL